MSTWYIIVLILVVLERLAELWVAKRNAEWSMAQGGREIGASHYPWMVMLHLAFLVCCVVEPLVFPRVFIPWFAVAMTVAVILAQALRWWVIGTLGKQWNTRVIIIPNFTRVRRGPYRFLNHPNYMAVITELFALPMIHGAWMTAVIFSLLNLWMLKVRIAVEDHALEQLREQ